jgi:hypothetical protein
MWWRNSHDMDSIDLPLAAFRRMKDDQFFVPAEPGRDRRRAAQAGLEVSTPDERVGLRDLRGLTTGLPVAAGCHTPDQLRGV